MRTTMLEELARSERIVRDGHEVVPRFRILTPEGEWVVFTPLPDDPAERQRRMQLVAGFMAWKMATAFILAGELVEPDSLHVTYVGREDRALVVRKIARKPLSFGEPVWLDESAIDEEVVQLLPPRQAVLSRELEAELIRAFGPAGEFEAARVN